MPRRMLAQNYLRAFARHANVASQPLRTTPAGVVTKLHPRDLIRADNHPRGRIRRVICLVEIIGSVQVDIGSVGIHLFAIVRRRRIRTIAGYAVIFVMLQENLLIGVSNEITRSYRRYVGLRGPRAQSFGKHRRKLAHPERFFFYLSRKNCNGRRGFAIRRMEIESGQRNTVLYVDPNESSTLQVWSASAGNNYVSAVTNLNRLRRSGKHSIECVEGRHIPAIVERAVRQHAMHELAELLVTNYVVRRSPNKMIRNRELLGWNRFLKNGLIVFQNRGLRFLRLGLLRLRFLGLRLLNFRLLSARQ